MSKEHIQIEMNCDLHRSMDAPIRGVSVEKRDLRMHCCLLE